MESDETGIFWNSKNFNTKIRVTLFQCNACKNKLNCQFYYRFTDSTSKGINQSSKNNNKGKNSLRSLKGRKKKWYQ